jgi:hypothetical protein
VSDQSTPPRVDATLFSRRCVPRNGVARKNDASAVVKVGWTIRATARLAVYDICRPFRLQITSAAERHDRGILAHRGRYNASEYLPRAIRACEQVHRIFSARGNVSLSLARALSLSLSLFLSRVNESANTGRGKAMLARLRHEFPQQPSRVTRTRIDRKIVSTQNSRGKHNRDTRWPSRNSPISYSLARISRCETRRFARGAEIARSALARGCARSLLGNNRS